MCTFQYLLYLNKTLQFKKYRVPSQEILIYLQPGLEKTFSPNFKLFILHWGTADEQCRGRFR